MNLVDVECLGGCGKTKAMGERWVDEGAGWRCDECSPPAPEEPKFEKDDPIIFTDNLEGPQGAPLVDTGETGRVAAFVGDTLIIDLGDGTKAKASPSIVDHQAKAPKAIAEGKLTLGPYWSNKRDTIVRTGDIVVPDVDEVRESPPGHWPLGSNTTGAPTSVSEDADGCTLGEYVGDKSAVVLLTSDKWRKNR